MALKIYEVKVDIPEGYNVVLGQSHFIKTVEDLYEVMATSCPGLRFGIAFCESSGKALIRHDGNDEEAEALAVNAAGKIGAGHSFIIFMKGGYPINVLDRIKAVQEVVGLFAATANPLTVIVAENEQGRGILGVIDGVAPKGVEGESDKEERHGFLRKIGYKR